MDRSLGRSRLSPAAEKSGRNYLLRLVDQRAQVERLPDEALGAALSSLAPHVQLAAEHHDRNRAHAVALLHAAQHLPAVDLGHHHVEQDQVRRLVLERRQPVFRVRGLPDGVALHFEVDPHDLAHLRVVVHEQYERAARGLARTAALEERLEVVTLVAAMAAGGVEGRHAADVGPLADRALGDAEEFCRLPEGQPVVLTGSRSPRSGVTRGHTANLPKYWRSLHLASGSYGRTWVSGGREADCPVRGDRATGLRIVLDRLPESDAEQEHEHHDQDPDAPADQLPAALLAPALRPLDRGQGAHGA